MIGGHHGMLWPSNAKFSLEWPSSTFIKMITSNQKTKYWSDWTDYAIIIERTLATLTLCAWEEVQQEWSHPICDSSNPETKCEPHTQWDTGCSSRTWSSDIQEPKNKKKKNTGDSVQQQMAIGAPEKLRRRKEGRNEGGGELNYLHLLHDQRVGSAERTAAIPLPWLHQMMQRFLWIERSTNSGATIEQNTAQQMWKKLRW